MLIDKTQNSGTLEIIFNVIARSSIAWFTLLVILSEKELRRRLFCCNSNQTLNLELQKAETNLIVRRPILADESVEQIQIGTTQI
jgi:hypothetical protein